MYTIFQITLLSVTLANHISGDSFYTKDYFCSYLSVPDEFLDISRMATAADTDYDQVKDYPSKHNLYHNFPRYLCHPVVR